MSTTIDETSSTPMPDNRSNLSSFIDDELNQMPTTDTITPTPSTNNNLFPLPDDQEEQLKKQREEQKQQKQQQEKQQKQQNQKSKINEMMQNLNENYQLQDKLSQVKSKVLNTSSVLLPSQVSQWAHDVIQKGAQYSKQLNHVQVPTATSLKLESVVSRTGNLMRNVMQSYEPVVTEKWNTLESHPLFQKVFIVALLSLSVICPPLAVGIFVFRLCRESNSISAIDQQQQQQQQVEVEEKSSKHMTKIVLSSMILCFALCFLLYVPGVLYGWLVLSRFFTEAKVVPFWTNEDVSFPWFKLPVAPLQATTTTTATTGEKK